MSSNIWVYEEPLLIDWHVALKATKIIKAMKII
jgi:hypothetical protein